MNKKTVFVFGLLAILCLLAFALTVNGGTELGLAVYFAIGLIVKFRYEKLCVATASLIFLLSALSEFVFTCFIQNMPFAKVVKDIFMTGFRNAILTVLGMGAALLVQCAIKTFREYRARKTKHS